MRAPVISPTGVNRTFGRDEVIVSKTDLQGKLTYVNDVFVRVSRFSEEDLIGRPHNVIRHPDMPRVVFWLLWKEITAGNEIFAFVKNLSSDGAHYWVLAHVTPTIIDGRTIGYHSNRRAPDPASVAAITPIYEALLGAERACTRPHDALQASQHLLDQVLAERSVTYDEFVWSIAGKEGR